MVRKTIENDLDFLRQVSKDVLKDDVSDVERKLKKKIPEDKWIQMHHSMIFFGRYFCKAISPSCDICKLKGKCRVNYK